MNKKDYKIAIELIRNARSGGFPIEGSNLDTIINLFSEFFLAINPKFNKKEFSEKVKKPEKIKPVKDKRTRAEFLRDLVEEEKEREIANDRADWIERRGSLW